MGSSCSACMHRSDAQVMLTFGYKVLSSNQSNWQNETYGLLACVHRWHAHQASPNNLIIDGFEDAYGYSSQQGHHAAYQTMKVDNALKSANLSAFATNYKASYSFWLGSRTQRSIYGLGILNNIANNQYSPAQFQLRFRKPRSEAKSTSGSIGRLPAGGMEYPAGVCRCVEECEKDGSIERFRGTIKDTATWTAHTEQSVA